MSFVSTFRLASVLKDVVCFLVALSSVLTSAAWSWPGGAGVNCPNAPSTSKLWDGSSAFGSLKCVVNPQASLSILNRGLTVWERFKGSLSSLRCARVSLFGDGIVAAAVAALPTSVTTFCEELDAANFSDALPERHSFSKLFCFLSVSSRQCPASHPRGDTVLPLFFRGCAFTLRQELELIPPACFFVLNIAKRHFSLRFLHIQSCSLQYKRVFARRERWQTPLIEDMDPFFLLRYFALRPWLCVRCIWERSIRVYDEGVTWAHEAVGILSAVVRAGWASAEIRIYFLYDCDTFQAIVHWL